MIIKISPTRVALLNLKRELKVAEKGYKLLKDKRDGLMKVFLGVIRDARALRAAVEERSGDAFATYARASALMHAKNLNAAFLEPGVSFALNVRTTHVMSVPVPTFDIEKSGDPHAYGMLESNGDLDVSIERFDEVLTDIVRLAGLEKTAERLAEEIERTRRRVSALENTRMPNLRDTIRFINQQLEERARDAVVSTMRVKAMILAKEVERG
ncbi:MAG: V-type ATP synthase subunit D [Candidatus Pacebacteria bacterium]|nr:V-type ATP synthase subunit D [Candidatus Paceibacterota bacterium]